MTSGYDRLSLMELDLLFDNKDRRHKGEMPEAELEEYLDYLNEKNEREIDEGWVRYQAEKEEEARKDPIVEQQVKAVMKCVDAILEAIGRERNRR